MERSQRTITLASGELPYTVVGEGRPVLYLHPAGGVRWTPVLERLAESHQLFIPVLPGYDGTLFHDGVDSVPALAKMIGEFVDAAIGVNCDVIGHSFGGWVATWLAVERPDRVEHLVLECAAGFRPALPNGVPSDPAALRAMLFAHPEKLTGEEKPPEVEAGNRTATMHYRGPVLGVDDALVARLGEIENLTLIVHGTEDRRIPAASSQLLRREIKHAYLVYIWDAGHAIEIDQPERLFDVVDSFLKRSEAFIVNWGTTAIPLSS
ncbi:MAG TPA: alpha/beta hydrolase [Candidatus Limnocylindria bacterium]|nr:alpha/beta hydrolase [Candidatus Limnocylindria bacterium]